MEDVEWKIPKKELKIVDKKCAATEDERNCEEAKI